MIMERIAGLLSLGQKNSTTLAPSETLIKLKSNGRVAIVDAERGTKG
jgi:hypothetical protein